MYRLWVQKAVALAAAVRSLRLLATLNFPTMRKSGGGLSLYWSLGWIEEKVSYHLLLHCCIDDCNACDALYNCTHSYVRDVTWNTRNKRFTREVANYKNLVPVIELNLDYSRSSFTLESRVSQVLFLTSSSSSTLRQVTARMTSLKRLVTSSVLGWSTGAS